jgi:hypothetical protein
MQLSLKIYAKNLNVGIHPLIFSSNFVEMRPLKPQNPWSKLRKTKCNGLLTNIIVLINS